MTFAFFAVGVGCFNTIIECLEKEARQDETALIQNLQISATLVQGCWVLKSHILYPDNETQDTQPTTAKKKPQLKTPLGTSYIQMQNAREYAVSCVVVSFHPTTKSW